MNKPLEKLKSAFEKRIIWAPKAMWEQMIEQQLEEWGLPESESISPNDILHSINFHHMVRVYSKNKKHFLLKLLLNDRGLDIKAGEEDNSFVLRTVEGLEHRAEDALQFLSERGPIVENKPTKTIPKKDVKKEDVKKSEDIMSKEVVEVKSTLEEEQTPENDSNTSKDSDVEETASSKDESSNKSEEKSSTEEQS